MNAIIELEKIIKNRKLEKADGSYTCYLFEKGLDKILKKCGEECAEMIIAAKNGEKKEVVMEASDLIYHMLVLLAQLDIPFTEMEEELTDRAKKQNNLKMQKVIDRNS